MPKAISDKSLISFDHLQSIQPLTTFALPVSGQCPDTDVTGLAASINEMRIKEFAEGGRRGHGPGHDVPSLVVPRGGGPVARGDVLPRTR